MSVVRGHDDRSREPIVQLPNDGLSMINAVTVGTAVPRVNVARCAAPRSPNGLWRWSSAYWNRVVIRLTAGGDVVEATGSQDGDRAHEARAPNGAIVEDDVPRRHRGQQAESRSLSTCDSHAVDSDSVDTGHHHHWPTSDALDAGDRRAR